jgi:hypothetical protein
MQVYFRQTEVSVPASSKAKKTLFRKIPHLFAKVSGNIALSLALNTPPLQRPRSLKVAGVALGLRANQLPGRPDTPALTYLHAFSLLTPPPSHQ